MVVVIIARQSDAGQLYLYSSNAGITLRPYGTDYVLLEHNVDGATRDPYFKFLGNY